MAPMTRRQTSNTGVSKKVHRKRSNQAPTAKRQTSDSWELLDREGLATDAHGDALEEDEEEDPLQLTRPMDVQSAVGPLREMAERVGQEVELFAEALDKCLEGLPRSASTSQKFEWAVGTIEEFHDILEYRVEELGKTLGAGKDAQTRKEWLQRTKLSDTLQAAGSSALFKTSQSGERNAQQVQNLRDLQQESDLWRLLKALLELRTSEDEVNQEREERRKKLKRLGPAHRYTPEDELWERFELSNEVAIERKIVKAWLERTADTQGSTMKDFMAELENKAGRGKGLWTSGWMHTREKIKGEKRLRDWPSDVDSQPPQIRSTGNNDLLTSRVDPDAPTRQQRALEAPDAYFERAIWIACWEMLRRGRSWDEICEWCESRKEGWRASCLGMGAENTEAGSSRLAWRHLCRLAAQSGCSSDYEAAVFGLLGGDEDAVRRVSHSVNDRIYAFYNAKILQAFDSFVVTHCPDNMAAAQWSRKLDAHALETPAQGREANNALLTRLRKEATTREEMLQPMKIMQCYMLTDEIQSLLNTVGIMVGEAARGRGAGEDIFFLSRKPVDAADHKGEQEIAHHPQTLRMATHLSIVSRVLLEQPLEGDNLLEDDNIVAAYIQTLRTAGKRDVIPMYASRLQEDRYVAVLGRVLQDVSDGDEQVRMIKLLENYKLDVIRILTEQMNIAFRTIFAGATKSAKPFRMLENTTETKLHPGQRIIVGCLVDDVTQADEELVTALQWFELCSGNWAVTFKSLTEALTRCLLHGNIPCARLIVQTFPYENIARQKSREITGTALNPMDPDAPQPTTKHAQMTFDLMKRQSRTYHELEQLVHAMEALAHWRDEEHNYVNRAPKPPTVPANLKDAKKAVTAAMEPLIGAGILMRPRDEQEAADLDFIRDAYLPELVLAYNTVLHAAGNLITRDALLESMDLSVAVADQTGEKGGNGLAEAFQRAGRMRELVGSFALTAKVMLVLKAEGKAWKAKRGQEGKELGIWEIGSGEGGDE